MHTLLSVIHCLPVDTTCMDMHIKLTLLLLTCMISTPAYCHTSFHTEFYCVLNYNLLGCLYFVIKKTKQKYLYFFQFFFRKKKKDKQKEKLKEAAEHEQQAAMPEVPICRKTKAEIAFEKRKWKKVNRASKS